MLEGVVVAGVLGAGVLGAGALVVGGIDGGVLVAGALPQAVRDNTRAISSRNEIVFFISSSHFLHDFGKIRVNTTPNIIMCSLWCQYVLLIIIQKRHHNKVMEVKP